MKYLANRKKSFGYAFKGLATVVRTQPHARIHIVAALVVILAGWWFHISQAEWFYISTAIALVWILEALNTAIEFLVDLVSPEYHELAGKAKDCAAAAVLIAAFFAVVVAGLVFIPKVV